MPGLERDSFALFTPVGGITGALVFGGEASYVSKPWGAGFIVDIAPVGLPITGSGSITSQFSYRFAIHHFSRWFQKPARFSFIFTPLTTLVARYTQTALSHNGIGFALEAQIEGPMWENRPMNWVFSLNWNRMTWVRLGYVPSGTNAHFVSSEIMGTEGGSTQMIYALVGVEMNFSVR